MRTPGLLFVKLLPPPLSAQKINSKISNPKNATTKILSPKMSSDGFFNPKSRSSHITVTNITEYLRPVPGNIPG